MVLVALTPSTAVPTLCRVARQGDLDEARSLLQQGHLVTARSALGWTPLHGAAWCDAGDLARELIVAGADPDARTVDGLSPAMVAAGRGSAATLACLCANHATLSLRSPDGRTALESAVQAGHLELALDLIQAGAPLDSALVALILRAVLHDQGQQLWHIEPRGDATLRTGHWCWLTRGVLPTDSDLLDPLQPWLIESSTDRIHIRGRITFLAVEEVPDDARPEGMPSAAWRHRQGWTEPVEAALHGDLPPDQPDSRGFLPILDAIRAGSAAAVSALLDLGADPCRRPHYGLMRGATLLHNAADNGNSDSIHALINAGAEVDATTASGWTALMVAARRGHLDAVHELLRAGANQDLRNAQGQTAIAVAQKVRRVKVARALLVASNVPLATAPPELPAAGEDTESLPAADD